jgi:hypothetical protein
MRTVAALAILTFAACGTSADLDTAEPLKVTICELSRTPAKFDGRRVDVTARVESDGIEQTTLIDRNCPDTGVAPDTPVALRKNADMQALQAAIFSGRPGTLDKSITASFRGVFHWHPRQIPVRVLTLESVTELHVEITTEEKGSAR